MFEVRFRRRAVALAATLVLMATAAFPASAGKAAAGSAKLPDEAGRWLEPADHVEPIADTPAVTPLAPDAALVTIAANVPYPVAITHAGDGTERVFITLQQGQVIIYDGTQVLPTPFLDIADLVTFGGEQGLLSVAFHPDYTINGYFYVNYTDDTGGDTIVARYSVSEQDPNVADESSAVILFEINQPYSNHNGGQLQFGPDGYLYVGMGDGGSFGDPGNRGQDLTELLGKMLRIDVDPAGGDPPDCGGGSNYSIPPNNPFVDGPGGNCDEIWAFGMRNPWRFSFDRVTSNLFVGDVGQDTWEEVDYQLVSSPGGENYGWRLMEGPVCYDPPTNCDDGTLTYPVIAYQHTGGRCAVTGGYQYRGTALPGMVGRYWYADYCTGEIFHAIRQGGQWRTRLFRDTNFIITSFGEDEGGELCFSDYSSTGEVYCILPTP